MTVVSHSRIVLVTGCSDGGIGYHLALEFAAQGCVVFAGVRSPPKAQSLGTNTNITLVELDITDDTSVTNALALISEATGGHPIDILVNNAGVFCVSPVAETNSQRVQSTFDTNVVGLARMCSAVAPAMIDRRRGAIVNIGSVSGYVATPWVGVYAATKAAVHAYSDALRMELCPFGVSVVVVAPGSVRSNLVANHGANLLEQDSKYARARGAVEMRAELSQAGDSMAAQEFARSVVSRILSSSRLPAYITCGTHAAVMWLMYYVPPIIRDRIFAIRFGTRQLGKDVGPGNACPVSGRSGGGCPMSVSPSCPITSPSVLCVAASVAAAALYYLCR
ncbi:NADPH-dependent 1-acyl dihydroxyacetone phosphate reductase [Coemansia sp. BCRC 34301]|nr:NADPH-dependent 1-acyl dihydroxyacetone phosphate reductase [Coemansia sp. BCRC 34301]